MKLNKFAYLYSKPLGNHTLKIMKKIPGNLLKKPGKMAGKAITEFCQSQKSGNPDKTTFQIKSHFFWNVQYLIDNSCLGRWMWRSSCNKHRSNNNWSRWQIHRTVTRHCSVMLNWLVYFFSIFFSKLLATSL